MSNPFYSGGGGQGGHSNHNPGGGGFQGQGQGQGGQGGHRSGGRSSGGGGGRTSNNYRSGGGGGGGGDRGGSSGGGGRGYRGGRYDSSRSSGRWNQSSSGGGRGGGGGQRRGDGGRGGGGDKIPAKFSPCGNWTRTGSCPHHPNCNFAHVVQLHATVDASSFVPPTGAADAAGGGGRGHQQQQQVKAAVSDVAIWEAAGQIKIFTGSYDGFWRLWNAGANFAKEFETKVGIKVSKINVTNSFLFCGMEAIGHAVPDTPVGMVHAWNLAQPNVPPLELHMSKPYLPYSHNQCVSAIAIIETTVVTGSRDGSIRIWKFGATNEFVLDKTLPGHAREVTGLVVVDQILWSSSIDGSIRIWDMASGECQYSIPKQSAAAPANPAAPSEPPNAANGHSGAITALVSFQSPGHGTFVLSSSLDSTIKAWNGTTGECVASEAHNGQGVVSMAIVDAPASVSGLPPGAPPSPPATQQVLLAGLDSGRIVARNLMQTATTPALEALFVLDSYFTASHSGAVRCIAAGPASTFYSGGDDGNLMVWQINGDLGL